MSAISWTMDPDLIIQRIWICFLLVRGFSVCNSGSGRPQPLLPSRSSAAPNVCMYVCTIMFECTVDCKSLSCSIHWPPFADHMDRLKYTDNDRDAMWEDDKVGLGLCAHACIGLCIHTCMAWFLPCGQETLEDASSLFYRVLSNSMKGTPNSALKSRLRSCVSKSVIGVSK